MSASCYVCHEYLTVFASRYYVVLAFRALLDLQNAVCVESIVALVAHRLLLAECLNDLLLIYVPYAHCAVSAA